MIPHIESRVADEDWTSEPAEQWRTDAACQQHPTETFFPEKGEQTKNREAKLICSGCPVVAACLEYAMKDSYLTGIWGGLSERQRKVARRKLAGRAA